jgi:hypothetical protein
VARAFTNDQLDLISGSMKVRVLAEFILDTGTYSFCDDMWDLSDGINTYIGANALFANVDIKSADGLSAESVTLTIDGNRIGQSGFTDPAELFRGILGLNYQGRRVNLYLGFMPVESQDITLTVAMYSGLINSIKVMDPAFNMIEGSATGDVTKSVAAPQGVMTIALDSLAIRYNRSTYRTRSHADQQNISRYDMFFSFVDAVVANEFVLYWGAKAPTPPTNVGTVYGSNGYIPPGGFGRGSGGYGLNLS